MIRVTPVTQTKADWFESFLDTYRGDAIRLSWRLLGPHRHLAEDVVQQAFVKAWHKRSSFRGTSSPKTWVFRIIVNQVRSYQRWHAVRVRAMGWLKPSPELTGSTPVESDYGLQQRIAEAVSLLSQQQREAFVLVYLDGLKVREAAEVLNRAEGTVKSHLHRAVGKLRKELEDVWETHR